MFVFSLTQIKRRGIPQDKTSAVSLPDEVSVHFDHDIVVGVMMLFLLQVQDFLEESVKTYTKAVQFVYEYMCIVQEKTAALPGKHLLSLLVIVVRNTMRVFNFYR